MRCAFEKSWGAELVEGGARFRLWSPDANGVSVRCAETGREAAMSRDGNGWWSAETDLIPPDGGYLYALADGLAVPDPAARAQTGDVHGPSRLVDPCAHEWREDWVGRPWEESVVYELHIGTFTPEGTFDAAIAKLPHLRDLGVTAVEIMPVAQFSGDRGWGYDGVLLYAPHRAYGGPEGLKRLVDACHAHGLMAMLDVVYNHFGPDGNYLHAYAPRFFHEERQTPWGSAIAFDEDAVRRFFIENPLYWIEEYRFDGLRFDAVNQIDEQADTPILADMARAIRTRFPDRPIHLVTEDDRNIVRLHPRDPDGRAPLFTAEWNDDVHHVAHVAATGETQGYYEDYDGDQAAQMAKALASGFVFQGERSKHLGEPRGVTSGGQPPTAFVNFIQNHDQVGNRPLGDRLAALAEPRAMNALSAILLLSPQIPMLFMGEEWGETRPFCFFTDFHGDLAEAVREGRRREFSYFHGFGDPDERGRIPDPNDPATFEMSRPDWTKAEGEGAETLALMKRLIAIRRAEIAPRLKGMKGGAGRFDLLGGGGFQVRWTMGDGARLTMLANIADAPGRGAPTRGRLLFETEEELAERIARGAPTPGWSAVVSLEESLA